MAMAHVSGEVTIQFRGLGCSELPRRTWSAGGHIQVSRGKWCSALLPFLHPVSLWVLPEGIRVLAGGCFCRGRGLRCHYTNLWLVAPLFSHWRSWSRSWFGRLFGSFRTWQQVSFVPFGGNLHDQDPPKLGYHNFFVHCNDTLSDCALGPWNEPNLTIQHHPCQRYQPLQNAKLPRYVSGSWLRGEPADYPHGRLADCCRGNQC